jgi:cytochrome c biogenesis protein CcmG/thiol:disulfide interchange protein DsbE
MLAFGLTRKPGEVRSAMIGRPAPGFALPTIDGQRTLRFSDLRGQVVVVNFWASWCGDCITEHPALAAAWQRFRDQGVAMIGVVYEDPAAAAARFVRAHGVAWPEVLDPGDRTSIAYGVRGVPETFFIARDGRVAAQHSGPVSYDLLSREITRLLGVSR